MSENKGKSKAQARAGWKFWAPRLAFAIAVPLILLALTEGALRLLHVGYSTTLMEPCTIHGQRSDCYNLFFAAPYFPPGMIKTPQFFSIDPVKPKDTYRIFVLGESAAMGDPDFAYGFSRYLEVMLRTRFPQTKFEVVNTGIVAINSHTIRSIARQLADYQPDLFICYIGNNEVVGPYGTGTALTTGSTYLPIIRASIFVRSSRIGQLLVSGGKARREWGGMEMFLDKQVPAKSRALDQNYRNFSLNLRDIVDAGQRAGARVLLSTVATNLRNSAPFGSLHRTDLKSNELQDWTLLVNQGIALESAQSYAEALAHFLSAQKIDDQYAELYFRIARCELALGHLGEAQRNYIHARDMDTLRFRADSRINFIIRSTADFMPTSTKLVDSESLLTNASPDGVIGSEFMYDHVHLTPRGNYLLSRAFYEQIVNNLPANAVKGGVETGPLTEDECERMLALTAHDRARIASEMIDRLQRPPFTKQLDHKEQVQNLIFIASVPSGSPQETATEYQWAISQAPKDLALHYKFGFFLFDFDRMAAAQQLILAKPADDFPVFLPDGTRIQ